MGCGDGFLEEAKPDGGLGATQEGASQFWVGWGGWVLLLSVAMVKYRPEPTLWKKRYDLVHSPSKREAK